jgi:hypothetical protein
LSHIYAGISGVKLGLESFDLGEGVLLRQTYAHLFSPFLVAFAPPGPEGYHPPPWSAAEGGLGFDVHVQLSVPGDYTLGDKTDTTDVVWWIAALLRMARFPYLTVPVLSSHPFAEITESEANVRLRPMEVTPRIMGPGKEVSTMIESELLEWIRDRWIPVGRLLYSHRKFRSVFQAFDAATIEGKRSSSLLALWGGLEQLFGSGRYRIASLIAAYLAPPGEERLATYRRVLKLYDARSAAAHTANKADVGPLLETYVLMRNALVKIVDEGRVPAQDDLEGRLFKG